MRSCDLQNVLRYICVPIPCRSGKTSIKGVLFDDTPPRETFYLDATNHIAKHHFECVSLALTRPTSSSGP